MTAAEHVNMKVRHALARLPALVDNNAISIFRETLPLRDLCRGEQQVAQ